MINRNGRLQRQLLGTTVFASAIFFGGPAYAQAGNQTGPGSPIQQTEPLTEQTVQETAPDNDEAIVVTGSLIRNPNLVSSAPVVAIGSDEIELQQSNVAEELLRELPGVVPSVGSAVNNGNGGASFVNLRGLGANRNLVLLDGTRIVPAGLAGVVDLNNIPLALVSRVDVLTGGATTTYGADAVSGVVNFITRSDFAGVDLSVSNQITERGDGHTVRADLTIGANFDDGRGNAAFSVGYQQADPVFQGDREFSVSNISSFSGNAGGSSAAIPAVLAGYGGPLRQISPDGQSLVPFYAPFNFNPFNIFQTPFERFNMFGTASYEVTPGIEVYSQGLFSNNTVSTIIAPSSSFFNTFTIPFSNPFIPVGVRNTICTAQKLTAAQCEAAANATGPNDPNYRTFKSQVRRRFIEAGPRFSDFTTTLFQLKAGVRGDITESIGYDIFATHGRSENVQRQRGNGLFSRLQQSLLASDEQNCQVAAGGCVPFNLFGLPGSITDEMLAFVVGPSTSSTTQTELTTVRAVVNGDFGITSPFASEAIGFAVGAEYRDYLASSTSDLATQTPGEVLGNGAASPDVTGRYDVREVFGELIVPVVADRPFFHALQLEGGARYSEYSTAGEAFTWRVGGFYEPFESIRFRGNYNRATRAPNIGELFSPTVTGLDNLASDPCAGSAPVGNPNLRAVCLAQGAPAGQIGLIANPAAAQVNVTSGGNADLGVEEATTFTVGVVFQPTFFPGFSLSLDYYDIEITGAISSPTVGDVLGGCFNNLNAGSATDPACTGIRRNPATGGLDGSAADTPGIPLVLSNLGEIATSGVDLSANYRRDLGFAGLTLSFNGNWTETSTFKASPSAIDRDCVGFYSGNCASIQPEFSFNQRTTLTFGGVDVSLLWRYIDEVVYEPLQFQDDLAAAVDGGCEDPLGADPDGCIVNPEFRRIPAEHYFDLTTRFEVSDNFTFTFTIQNLFDNQPTSVGSEVGSTSFNSGNVYPSTYDALGRRYAVGARIRF